MVTRQKVDDLVKVAVEEATNERLVKDEKKKALRLNLRSSQSQNPTQAHFMGKTSSFAGIEEEPSDKLAEVASQIRELNIGQKELLEEIKKLNANMYQAKAISPFQQPPTEQDEEVKTTGGEGQKQEVIP